MKTTFAKLVLVMGAIWCSGSGWATTNMSGATGAGVQTFEGSIGAGTCHLLVNKHALVFPDVYTKDARSTSLTKNFTFTVAGCPSKLKEIVATVSFTPNSKYGAEYGRMENTGTGLGIAPFMVADSSLTVTGGYAKTNQLKNGATLTSGLASGRADFPIVVNYMGYNTTAKPGTVVSSASFSFDYK